MYKKVGTVSLEALERAIKNEEDIRSTRKHVYNPNKPSMALSNIHTGEDDLTPLPLNVPFKHVVLQWGGMIPI